MTKGHQRGDTLARVDLDPYHRSFWNVGTHLLAPQLDEATLRAALKSGHAYVAHDWMCDATGLILRHWLRAARARRAWAMK
jgi:hypothetical protein